MARPGRTGIQVINAGTEPILADLVFVHGLQGDPVETWSHKTSPPNLRNRLQSLNPFRSHGRSRSQEPRDKPSSIDSQADTSSKASTFWPKDFLAVDIPNVRLLTFGYNSDVLATFRAMNQNNIMQHAQNLIGDLLGERNEVNRPIIVIAHSLGGLIIKEALRLSQGAKFQPRQQLLYQHTYGVIFFGTPHRGSPWAPWAKIAGNLTKLALQAPSTGILQHLQVDSAVLQIIADEFSKMIREDIKIHSFREEKGMSGLYGLDAKVVDDFSSIIGDAAEGQEGIDANHIQMCKFSSADDPGYKKVLRIIRAFVKEAQSKSSAGTDGGSVKLELEKLDRTLRRKLELDTPYNKLRISGTPPTLVLDMPVLQGNVFEATTDDFLTAPSDSKTFGSSIFELASILKLLPGQSRANLLETEPTTLENTFYDTDTYYGKCSRASLFKLITQHFVSIREASSNLIIHTDIGVFTLIQTDRQLLVHVNCNERSTGVLAPLNQDYPALQKCAAGLWCVRKGDETVWDTGVFLVPGTIQNWTGPFDVDTLLLTHSIEHHNCLYFLAPDIFQELQFRKQCAYDLEQGLQWVIERRREVFPRMSQAIQLFDALSSKRIIEKENLGVHVAAVKMILSDSMIATASLPVPTDDTARATQSFRPEESIVFLTRCVRFHDSLLEAYRTTPTRTTLQNLLLPMLDEDVKLVAGQLALAVLFKGNAEFVLHRAVEAPRMWLHLLSAADGDVYVG